MSNTIKKSAAMNLTEGPIAKTLIIFSMPFMLSTLLQTLYSTVDTVVVGQYLGSAGLSAVSNGSQLMQMVYMLCIGFINAGQVLISQYKGANDRKGLQNVVGTLFVISLSLSVILAIFCIVFSKGLLNLMATPNEAYDYAKSYIVICGAGLIFTCFYNMFSAILRGMGDSKHPLLFVFIASVINLILDVLFITKFHWGVRGAAFATIIGQACSVIFSFIYLSKNSERIGFSFKIKELKYKQMTAKKMMKIGIPMAVQSAAIQVSFLFVSRLVNELGVSVSAALGVAQKLRNIPGILTQGLSLGCSSMLGQNLGAGKNDRVSKTVKYGIAISTVINVFFGVIFLLFPVNCFRLFTQDETVLVYATMCMLTLVIELPARFFMPACNSLINAQGFAKLSMAIAFVDAFVGRVFLSWLLGKAMGLGAFGFFMGYTLATYLTSIPGVIYYATGLWKKRASLVG